MTQTPLPTNPPPDATIVLPIVEATQVGQARRVANALASRLEFSATRAAEVAIVVTELANNLVRHARGGGELLIRPVSSIDRPGDGSFSLANAATGAGGGGAGGTLVPGSGIEILSLDRGPGIENVRSAMRDGYSTGGTAGTGLGAVSRLASVFDIHSSTQTGTAILARLWPVETTRPTLPTPATTLSIGAVCIPLRGETLCGDAWHVEHDRAGDRTLAIVADGLGHGDRAADASQLAVATMRANLARTPKQIVEAVHAALRSTRGAAVAVLEIAHSRRTLTFCGVGNVTAAVVGTEGVGRGLVSHNGTVGVDARRINEFQQPWDLSHTLVLATDGITSRWQLKDYPGLLARHPGLIAGVLYRDHVRGRDDATLVVLRCGRPAAAQSAASDTPDVS